MNTIAVWILVMTFSPGANRTGANVIVIDNIATAAECQRLAKVIDVNQLGQRSHCVQAIKVKQ
jgi:hypothetical protein